MINTGSLFRIGSTHKICQDYTVHGPNYIILSDGCSGVENSDFGARILVKAAEVALPKYIYLCKEDPNFNVFDKNSFFEETISLAKETASNLGLNEDCLFATLFLVTEVGNTFKICGYGDGVIAIQGKANSQIGNAEKFNELTIFEFAFPENAPYYPIYEYSPGMKDIYLKDKGDKGKCFITKLREGNNETFERTVDIINEPMLDLTEWKDFVSSITLFSDGAASFVAKIVTETSRTTSPITTNTIVNDMIDYKSNKGEFVLKQFQKTMREYRQKNWEHTDDFSMATIVEINP